MIRFFRPRLALFVLAVSPCLAVAAAQTPDADAERDIDMQVWIPMLRGSNQFDPDLFLGVLSPDLVRVSIDRNEVYGMDRYTSEIRAGFARARERGIRRTTTVRFLTRTQTNALARDTGIFRSEVTMPGGEARLTYTAFEMILRKENGLWKLLVDQDTSRGGSIAERDFLAGRPLSTETGPPD
jgi:hypothetical protein